MIVASCELCTLEHIAVAASRNHEEPMVQIDNGADNGASIGPRVIDWQMPGCDPWDNPGARQASPG